MFEFLKNKNVMTIDVWVFVVLLFTLMQLIPASKTYLAKSSTFSDTSVSLIISGTLLTILALIIMVTLLLICSKLRSYRYLDIYAKCTKVKWTKTKIALSMIITISALVCLLIGIILSFGFTYDILIDMLYHVIYFFIMITIIMMLSIHFNEAKDIKVEE